MAHPPSRRRFFLAALAALVACTSAPTTVCGCDPMPPAGRIHGIVRGPDGAAVAGARVRAEASSATCAAPFRVIGEVVTNASGRFRTEVHQVFDLQQPGVCLRAYADPPAQGSLAASDTVPFEVDFARGAVRDSARVDLFLRAR